MTDSSDSQRQVNVLVVEDSPTQAALIEAMVEDQPRLNLLASLGDGVAALAYLKREGEYADVLRPDLILLDLYLPNKDGNEVLEELRADAQLKSIPVVMLTSSDDKEDVSKCYAAGANSFIRKPVDSASMERVIKQFADYWGGIIEFPEPC